MDRQDKKQKNTVNMQDPEHNLLGTEKKNGMEHTHIMNDGRSISEEGTWQNPHGEEKPRTTNKKNGETHWCKQVFSLEEGGGGVGGGGDDDDDDDDDL
jgi:hypothetical protein